MRGEREGGKQTARQAQGQVENLENCAELELYDEGNWKAVKVFVWMSDVTSSVLGK